MSPEHVAIVNALAQVDEGQREVVVLHYLADLGTAERTIALQVSSDTVVPEIG